MTCLDERMQRSETARRCDCGDLVQTRRVRGRDATVTLEVYPTEDGTWAISYELEAFETGRGLQAYRQHRCTGDE